MPEPKDGTDGTPAQTGESVGMPLDRKELPKKTVLGKGYVALLDGKESNFPPMKKIALTTLTGSTSTVQGQRP